MLSFYNCMDLSHLVGSYFNRMNLSNPVGIITLYNSYNYGAFLQAYALQKTIRTLGYQSEFLDVSSAAANRKRVGKLLTKKLDVLLFNIRKHMAFKKAWQAFDISPIRYQPTRSYYPAVVIGSDEVWNINNDTFLPFPEFFGCALNSGRIIAYAPSSSSAMPDDFANYPEFVNGLKNMHALSIRDVNTEQLIEKLTGRKGIMVLDPTFLTEFNAEEVPSGGGESGYVLVYTYGFDSHKIAQTREFAQAHGLKLISLGFFNAWCDKSVAATPFEFLGWLRNATFVVTDTFHGTIFSVLYRKVFGTFADNKPKVTALLDRLGLQHRNLSSAHTLADVIEKPIDYSKVDEIISRERTISLNYLSGALADAGAK
jgi:hypothetical protein